MYDYFLAGPELSPRQGAANRRGRGFPRAFPAGESGSNFHLPRRFILSGISDWEGLLMKKMQETHCDSFCFLELGQLPK